MSATLPSDPSQPSVSLGLDNSKKTSRRQWSVQGGPRGLLRRMRSQLAEDGCPESQLVMGRTLLQQLGEDNETEDEDARLAVFWLTQASLQGSKEATELLQDCLNRNIGICEHNYREIKECLGMDLQEKLSRRAAHLLFCSVSDGNDFITNSSLSLKIQKLVSHGQEEKCSESNQENSTEDCTNLEELYGGERFTEDHLISASVLYCEGRVPPLHHYLTPSVSSSQSSILRIAYFPSRIGVDAYQTCLQFLGVVLTRYLVRILTLANPYSSIAILCLVAVMIALFGSIQVHVAIPAIISCIALTIMIISSAHMLLIRKRFDSFCLWSLVFSSYCPDLDTVSIENKFKSRCWKPYVSMFLGLIFYVGAVPLTSSSLLVNFLPCLYLLSFLTFILVPEKLSVWHFVSLFIHLAAVTPEIHKSISTWFLPFVEGSGIEDVFTIHYIYLGDAVRLNFSVASILHLAWCCSCLFILLKHGLVFLLPHLVSLIWCHLAVMASQLVTVPSSLIYPLAFWTGLFLLPYLTPLIVTTVPGLLIASLCLQFGFQLYTVGFVLASCITATWLLKNSCPNFASVCKVILGCAILAGFLQSSMVQKLPTVQYSNLQWENYKNVCWPSKDTGALTVHRCLPLQGTIVKWRGSVLQVEIVSVWNLPKYLFSIVPNVLEKRLRCHIGKQVGPCLINSKTTLVHNEHCHLIQNTLGSDACTLDNWNEYLFEITVGMSSSTWKFGSASSQVKVLADDVFREFALDLQSGDELEFVGVLSQNIGSQNLKLHLSSVACINCKLKMKPSDNQAVYPSIDVWVAPAFIFNFMMGPILSI